MIAKIISLVALAAYLALIFISLRQNGRRQVNQAFVLYLAAMAFWQLAAVIITFTSDPASALLWYRLMTAGMGGQFIFYSLFVMVFIDFKHRSYTAIPGWALFFGLVVSFQTDLIIKDVFLSPTGIYVPTFGKLVPVLGLIMFGYLGYSIYNLVSAYRQGKSSTQRNRIRYLLVGAAVIGLGSFSNLSSHTQQFPIDVTATVINAVIIAIAIGRHRLLDMSIMIRKGMLYSIPTVIIGTCYFLFISLATTVFHTHGDMQIIISFCLAVMAALIGQPLMNQAQNWVDRLFFREKYDSTQMLQRMSQTAASMLKLDSLTNLIVEEITNTIHIGKVVFFLRSDRTGDFAIAAKHGLDNNRGFIFKKDHPIIDWLRRNNKDLTRPEIEMLPQFKALWGREKEQLEQLDAELFIPVVAKNELVGVFTLGPKLSEEQYSPDDVRTITTLANQTAVAVENALLFCQLEGTLEALSIAHDELEMRIHARTTELAQTNEALKAENLERVKAEEEIKRYTKELERSNKELQQFAYVASHDLQEPLRMVGSFLQLLERRYGPQLDSNAKDFIHYAVDGAVRMQALINDLLEYSRVGTRGKPFEEVNLNEIVSLAKNNLKVAIKENNAEITSKRLPKIYGDGTQLTQVFQNLIGNAIKFHGEKSPEINISSVRNNGNYEIKVTDNGIGIDPLYKDKIFLIFQRLHNREDYPGTGIGLAICKRIIERHGGAIWVESEVGAGASFHFSIPARKREPV